MKNVSFVLQNKMMWTFWPNQQLLVLTWIQTSIVACHFFILEGVLLKVRSFHGGCSGTSCPLVLNNQLECIKCSCKAHLKSMSFGALKCRLGFSGASDAVSRVECGWRFHTIATFLKKWNNCSCLPFSAPFFNSLVIATAKQGPRFYAPNSSMISSVS